MKLALILLLVVVGMATACICLSSQASKNLSDSDALRIHFVSAISMAIGPIGGTIGAMLIHYLARP